MTPPDKLHASYSGLLKYAMETLQHMYGKRKKQLLALAMLDELHQDLCFILSRNSERDRPRPSVRNGVMDSTKTQSSERLAHFYNLLCLLHTTKGRESLLVALGTDKRLAEFQECIKLYLAMEAWFHDVGNDKKEVKNARERWWRKS